MLREVDRPTPSPIEQDHHDHHHGNGQHGGEERDDAATGGKHAGERQAIRQLGQAVGGQLHLGRSSGDLGAVARRLTIRTAAIAVRWRRCSS